MAVKLRLRAPSVFNAARRCDIRDTRKGRALSGAEKGKRPDIPQSAGRFGLFHISQGLILVGEAGFEPTASGSGGLRSIQLSYSPEFVGGP